MTVFTSLWALCNYLTNLTSFKRVTFNSLANHGAYLFAYSAILSGMLFTFYFPTIRRISNLQKWFINVSATCLLVLSLTTAGAGMVRHSAHSLVFEAGGLVWLYAILLIAYMLIITRNLRAALQQKGSVHDQAQLILAGFSSTVILGILSNIALPAIFNDSATTQLGPLFSIILVGSITYAIVRHRLFDIRAIIARSVGYILSVISLTVVFVAISFFVVGRLLFGKHALPVGQQIIYTVLAVLLAFAFPRLKQFFDKVTNRLFYSDAYDSQAFLDAFNKLIVATYELDPLLKKSATIIADNLKPSYCAFGIWKTSGSAQRVVANGTVAKIAAEDIAYIRKIIPEMNQKIIVTDDIDQNYQQLQKVLQKNNIAIFARLTSTVKEEGIGYLMLGTKKSGGSFNSQDVNVVEIVANELVIAIQNSLRFEEIENFTITLQQKVNDATRKLRHSNEKLKELDEAKDDFVSMASHQLRTPLTSVKGYISMVLEGDAGKINATQRQLLEQSFISSQRMVFLIADLLNVSRLKTGKFVIETKPTSLADLVEQEVAQLQDTAASRQLKLNYTKPSQFPLLNLDDTKTRQVIMNFIDNAIYYTPSGGQIDVSLAETPASVELRVIDNGIGVPKNDQHHLFTKFYRAGNARKARPDGTGIGLFMAKKVIVAQGGAVIFETEEGKGSTFGFMFSKTKMVPTTVATPATTTDSKQPVTTHK